MSDFVNTLDLIDDEVLCGSIIDKTVNEFRDDKVETIGQYAFTNCKNLAVVDIPNVTALNGRSFLSCSALKELNIPKVTRLDDATFYGTSSLEKVDLPMVTAINKENFGNSTSLETLILRHNGRVALGNVNALYNTPIANGTGYIYVPKAQVDGYKTATNWSTFADQFRALEDYTVDGTIHGELDESKI